MATEPTVRKLLERVDSLGSRERARLALAMRAPLAWPLPEDPLRSAADGLDLPSGLEVLPVGTALAATLHRTDRRGSIWLLGSSAHAPEPLRNGYRRDLEGRAVEGVGDARRALAATYGRRLEGPLQEAAVDAGWALWTERGGPPGTGIQGRSAGLASALALFSRATGVPVGPNRVGLARVDASGSIGDVNEEGLRAKLLALRSLCARPPVLLVARRNLAFVRTQTASWPEEIRPSVRAAHDLRELLLEEFPQAARQASPERPRVAVLTPALLEAKQRWTEAVLSEESKERDRIYVEDFAPGFAGLFGSLDIVDGLPERETGSFDGLVSVLGTTWQPAALLARRLKPARVLLLGTELSYRLTPSGQDPKRLVSEIGRVPWNSVDPQRIRDHAESDVYAHIREFVSGFSGARVAIDITGGKKSMSAAAMLAAGRLGLAAFYVDCARYDPEARAPVPGQEFPRRLVTWEDWGGGG